MILSLLKLDLGSPSVRQSFQNCQDFHRNIMKAFETDRSAAKVLYRVMRSDYSVQVYVQSQAEPQWERIEGNGFHCEKAMDISRLRKSFHYDLILRFTLLACPTKKTPVEGKNSRRVLIRGEEEQLEWLRRQGEKYGFAVLEAHITGPGERLSGKKDNGIFYIAGILFEGVLQITNTEKFQVGFENGIGAEKAYGFGMLMVSRL